MSKNVSKYECGNCMHVFQEREGITYISETEEYYGELSREEMCEFIELSIKNGWKNASLYYLKDKDPELIRTIMDDRRISWLELLNLKGNEMVLDYGCGLGGVSFLLNKHVSHVYAIDGCFERIRFSQIRKEQENITNITFICHGSPISLPFFANSLDLIIMNMVFPYLASSLPKYDINIAENIIMKELYSKLRPNGQIYMSVRNKNSIGRIKQFLPFYKGNTKPDNFHIATYAYYLNLIKTAGFKDIICFWPIPNYKYPEYFIFLGDSTILNPGKNCQLKSLPVQKKLYIYVAKKLNILKLLSETMIFIGRKD